LTGGPAIDAPEQAVILVGGLGTRLGALTRDLPKPLLDVAGRPFLDYMIENCVRFGFRNIILLAGYRGDRVEAYAEAARARLPTAVELDTIVEPAPRGTAGAIRFAADRLAERFLLLNGDSFFDFNWLDLMLAASPDRVAVMTLRRVANTARYGVVTMEGDRVTGFAERGDGGAGLINGGVYLFDRRILAVLPEQGSLEREVLPSLCARSAVGGRLHGGFFLDIGVPEAFARAQVELPRRRHRAAVFFDRDGTLNADSGYTHRPDDLVFLPGAIAAVKRVNDLGRFAFLVTNQAGIAKGHFSEADTQVFHAHMQRHLRAAGAHFDDIRYCPHHPNGTVIPYNCDCDRRKPAPGMLLDLMHAWPVLKDGSLMVGDKASDVQAGEAAGLRALLHRGGDLDDFLAPHLTETAACAGYARSDDAV
jgi:D,D-heptose 1,7-bisphosphate phosphatase